jgi:hypothetical protein
MAKLGNEAGDAAVVRPSVQCLLLLSLPSLRLAPVANLMQVSAAVGEAAEKANFAEGMSASPSGRKASAIKAMEKEGVAFARDNHGKPQQAACCVLM